MYCLVLLKQRSSFGKVTKIHKLDIAALIKHLQSIYWKMGCKFWDIVKPEYRTVQVEFQVRPEKTSLYVDVSQLLYHLDSDDICTAFMTRHRHLVQLNFIVRYVFDGQRILDMLSRPHFGSCDIYALVSCKPGVWHSF